MAFSKEFREMVLSDIQSISNACNLSIPEQLKLHRQLDGRYQACVKDWFKGFFACDKDATQIFYGALENRPEHIIENIELMKGKLETFSFEMNVIDAPVAPSTHVNVTTNVTVTITFEQVREKIVEMTSLTDEQTKEALEKVSEIESVVKGEGSKKFKWEKIKPILTWLADKSFDVAMTMLPLLLKVQE